MEASAKNPGRCREPGSLVGVSVYKLRLWADTFSSGMNYVAVLEKRKSGQHLLCMQIIRLVNHWVSVEYLVDACDQV